VTATLDAVELAGGAQALAAADPGAAACLCNGLMQAAGDERRRWLPAGALRRVKRAFKVLGPAELRAAAAGIRAGVPSSLQRACAAIVLTGELVEAEEQHSEAAGGAAGSQMPTTAPSASRVRLTGLQCVCFSQRIHATYSKTTAV
jgi:hypothetical protein